MIRKLTDNGEDIQTGKIVEATSNKVYYLIKQPVRVFITALLI